MRNFKGYKCTYRFNAFHNLSENIENSHPHTFWVNVYIECKTKEFTEFNLYEEQIFKYFNKYKGTSMNSFDYFKENLPTLENMCQLFYKEIAEIFEGIYQLEVVKVELSDGPLKTVSIGKLIIAGSVNLLIDKDDFDAYIARSLEDIK